MADALNPKQQKFGDLVAKGEPIWRAYQEAGYTSKSKKDMEANGFRLYRQPMVLAYIRQQQHKNAAKLGVGVEQIVKELDSMMRLARKVKHPAAGVGAITAKAKILGLMVDRQEVQQTVIRKPMRNPDAPSRMSIDDWKKQFAPKLDLPSPTGPAPDEPANDDEDAA